MMFLVPLLVAGHHPDDDGSGIGLAGGILALGFGALVAAIVGYIVLAQVRKQMRKAQRRRRR